MTLAGVTSLAFHQLTLQLQQIHIIVFSHPSSIVNIAQEKQAYQDPQSSEHLNAFEFLL